MAIASVLLDAAATFKSSSTHLGTAEGLAIKAIRASHAGDRSVAALHSANAQRAFTASVRDAAKGNELLSTEWHLPLSKEGRQVLEDARQATSSLRQADSRVYQRGPSALVRASSYRDGVPAYFEATTPARTQLLGVAGDTHALAVLPPG